MPRYSSLIFFVILILGCKDTVEPVSPYDLIEDTVLLSDMSHDLRECSGLEQINGEIYAINDSGDAPKIYRVNAGTGQVEHVVRVDNVNNVDWEDLALNDSLIFVGDFGNNRGSRSDLNIIIVKQDVLNADTAFAEGLINYTYADENMLIFENEMHDFNCEAMIALEDSLYIFTKNHISKNTRCYALPQLPGVYDITSHQTFDTEGLITAADFDEENRVLFLLGYNKTSVGHAPFVWCFWDFEESDFFKGKNKRFDIDLSQQTESLVHVDSSVIYISSERKMGAGGKIYQIDLKDKIDVY